jgi:UDP-2,3-diacylglucosamine pyrophosphatase LpxH
VARALVISDTHLGAWTGEDLLSQERHLERLAPQLEGIDELVILGDLFDFLFGTLRGCFDAADGLVDLIAAKLAGKKLVFSAGNHDHHLVHSAHQDLEEMSIASGRPAEELGGEVAERQYFSTFLRRRLPAVEVEFAYPTYRFAGVLLTHGHYLDPHARLAGSRGSRLLTHALWSIAAGGPEDPRTEADYESVITLLTEWLYVAAQTAHGTEAQRSVFRAGNRAGKIAAALGLPLRGAKQLAAALRGRSDEGIIGPDAELRLPDSKQFEDAVHAERKRQSEEAAAGAKWTAPYSLDTDVTRPSDPVQHSLDAFDQVVANLGWAEDTDQIVFAHTHQPLAGVPSKRKPGLRYWNTGSWIYEPDLSSRQAYASYLHHAWPGTAILIDSDEPEPQLLELLADLNPLVRSDY